MVFKATLTIQENKMKKIAIGLIVVFLTAIIFLLFGSQMKVFLAALIPILILVGFVFLMNQSYKKGWFQKNIHFYVFEWNTYVRYGLSLFVSLIIATLLLCLDILLDSELFDGWMFTAIVACITIFYAQAEPEDTIVPAGKVAIMTFWGFRFHVFINEGRYPWTGKSLGIHRSTETRTEGVTRDGFVNIKDFPMSIWNQASDRNNPNKLKLQCLASDNASEVFTTLTLTVRITDPIKWINSIDPALDLAEKAREALRSIIAFFTAIDNTKMKGVYWEMMRGKTIIAVFIPKSTHEYMKGTVLRSAGGAPMYEVVKEGETVDIAKANFKARVIAEADQEMLKVCLKLKNEDTAEKIAESLARGVLKIEERSVATVFIDVMDRVGVTVDSATIGNIDVSQVVTDAANKAASEPAQRTGQMASAETDRDAAIVRSEARATGVTEFELGVSAAADNENIRVVAIGGSNNSDLANAAALHATLSENNNGRS